MTSSELAAILSELPSAQVYGWNYEFSALDDLEITEITWDFADGERTVILLSLKSETAQLRPGAYQETPK